MKKQKATWRCIECDHEETNYKYRDGSFCPNCGSSYWIEKDRNLIVGDDSVQVQN